MSVHVEYAQLPPPEESADRIFITDNAVIVLDGATAFAPVSVSAQVYAQHLGQSLVSALTTTPDNDLRDALADAIRHTSESLELRAGDSPSSTVAILRQRYDEYDVLVLGDTPVLWGNEKEEFRLTDDRLTRVGVPQRQEYQDRLRAGCGFDAQHRRSLRALQITQRKLRNREGGYWVAEAEPKAAYKARLETVQRSQLAWAVIASDGAFDFLENQKYGAWGDIATCNSEQLANLLEGIYAWEEQIDPAAVQYPRAKQHDDKSIVAIRAG